MNVPSDRRADEFSDWLEARVAGMSTPGDELAADPELGALCAAADHFHGLSSTWAQDAMDYSPPVTTWEDLMTSNSFALPRYPSISTPRNRAGTLAGRWEAWNRFASGVLIAVMVIAIGAGAWRLAGDREFGSGTEPPATTGAFGLQPTSDDSAIATPGQTWEVGRSVPGAIPFDQLPGAESAISRAYSPSPARPAGVPGISDVTVSVYRFDSPANANASYDLIVSDVTGDLAAVQPNDPDYTVVTADLGGSGERSNLVRLDVTVTGRQSHEFILTLHETYVFGVMTVMSGPDEAGATPEATAEPSATETGLGLASALVANGQPSPEEAMFREDGTSSGGDWGFMPDAGDLLLAGLLPRFDKQAYPTGQTVSPERSVPVTTPVDQLPGIVSAVLRGYSASEGPPSIPDMGHISVSVYRFDSLDNANASYDRLVSNFTGEYADMQANNVGYTLVTGDLSGPGERSDLVRLDSADATGRQSQEFILTLHETYVFGVMTITGGPDEAGATPEATAEPTATALGLATALVAGGQPSPDEAIFYEDGTSTGGDWGFMPAAGDPLLAGLLPMTDQQLYPTNPNASVGDESFPPDAQDLTGIEAAVYRDYAPADVFIGTTTFDNATPMTGAELAATRYSSIIISVYQLDTAKDAAVAYDRLSRGLLGSLPDLNGGEGDERLVSEDLTGIGDGATRSHLTITSTDYESIRQRTFDYLTVQRGEFVFVIAAVSGLGPVETLPAPSDGPDPMLDLAVQIVSDGEASPDEPVFVENGTSTGGLWGFMPAQDDPLLMGLAPWMDQEPYPAQDR